MSQKDFDEQVKLSKELMNEVLAEEAEVAKLTKKFLHAQTEQEEAEKRLMEIFGADVDYYVLDGEFDLAMKSLSGMVDCVSRIFLIDRIQHAKKKAVAV